MTSIQLFSKLLESTPETYLLAQLVTSSTGWMSTDALCPSSILITCCHPEAYLHVRPGANIVIHTGRDPHRVRRRSRDEQSLCMWGGGEENKCLGNYRTESPVEGGKMQENKWKARKNIVTRIVHIYQWWDQKKSKKGKSYLPLSSCPLTFIGSHSFPPMDIFLTLQEKGKECIFSF